MSDRDQRRTTVAIRNDNILSYRLSLCSQFSPTHARKRVRHCLTAVSILRWPSSSKLTGFANAARRRSWSVLCQPSPVV